MKLLSLWAITVASLVGSAMADGIDGDGKYGAAGCGLGSMVFGDQKGKIQILAATTNDAIFPQTFAISSGTSNCADDGVALKDKEQEFFANANFESLHQEIAQGQGENLKAFATLFGCRGQAVETFSRVAHASFGTLFPSEKTGSAEMLGNVQSLVKTNPELQTSCSEKG